MRTVNVLAKTDRVLYCPSRFDPATTRTPTTYLLICLIVTVGRENKTLLTPCKSLLINVVQSEFTFRML